MQHWSQVATRNWRVKRVRTAGAILAIALGTGAVVWVTCCYESVRQSMLAWASEYIGESHINIESPMGKYDVLPERLVQKIETIDGVVVAAPSLVQRLPSAAVTAEIFQNNRDLLDRAVPTMVDVDFHGVDLAREPAVRDWDDRLIAGRMLTPDDENACVLEMSIAEEQGVGVDDYLLVWRDVLAETRPAALRIVGLIERQRIARFQKGVALLRLPQLQRICLKAALVNSIDVVLNDPTPENLRMQARQIHVAIRKMAPNVHVRSAASRMARIELAQEQQKIVLVLLSCMALLTALFIILSTLSMGMIERISQLGLLRCVGMTGPQLASLILSEVLPMGILGIVLGVPVGLALTQLTVWLVPEYVGTFTVSTWGILLATGAGLATTLLAASLPACAALTVSPLEATRPRTRRAGVISLVILFILALLTFAVQHGIITFRVQRDLEFVQWSAATVVLLYFAYAAVAPFMVWLVSRLAVPITALFVGVRTRLLQDQVGYAVWRSAGICCGLMVGLSLIVGLLVFNRSFRAGWQFPQKFPEAYIWSDSQIQGNVDAVLRDIDGIASFTTANAPNVIVEERNILTERIMRSITWFLGIDPETFFDLLELQFIEGDQRTARVLLARQFDGDPAEARRILAERFEITPATVRAALAEDPPPAAKKRSAADRAPLARYLRRGGSAARDLLQRFVEHESSPIAVQLLNDLLSHEQYVIIATDFARTRKKSIRAHVDEHGVEYSDEVRVWFNNRWETFKIAAVIDSPALDIAASYFQAQSEAHVAAVGSVIGTNADLQRLYSVRGTKLILINYDLPPRPVPDDWPPPQASPEAVALSHKHYDPDVPLEMRWQNHREERVLQEVCRRLGIKAQYGTARELKAEIDAEITRMTYLLTAVPSVALLVAALGVANLMTANVASRARQLAILRAVGATRGLILRIVLGEVIVLGVLGSVLGMALGLHLVSNVIVMTERMWGYAIPFEVPWPFVGTAVGLTVGLCLLAGIVPARHASRTNVIDALHVA